MEIIEIWWNLPLAPMKIVWYVYFSCSGYLWSCMLVWEEYLLPQNNYRECHCHIPQVSLQNFIQIVADIHVGLFNLSKIYPTFSDGLNEAVDKHMVVGISINNLSKKYGKTKAVDNINAEFYENQVTILLGHNGAAKTTTLWVKLK